jgi:putative peptidoglycan lipid II flippase
VSGFGTQGTVAVDPGGVGLAVDDDPSTEWTTGTYPDTKTPTGIGLLLDLPRPRTVDIAELLLSAPGAAVEIRAGSTRPDRAGDLPIVASRVDSAQAVRLRLTRPVRARYWLVWFTTLPKSGPHTSRLGVAEIALLR